MFRKTELVDSLNRDLARARNKRDTLASLGFPRGSPI
jgi:hypothetical protein